MVSGGYGVGIIGAGWVAGEYVKAFASHPRTTVQGIYSRTPGKAAHLLAAHGVAAHEYTDVDQMFADEAVQIVVSCTPPDARPTHLVRAAETGRHVVIEKPVATTPDGVRQIRRAVTAARVKSVTSFVLRWNPQFETVKRLLADNVVGELVYAEADYWHPIKPEYPSYRWAVGADGHGGSALNAGCHAVDALRYLGGEIVEVAAFSAGPKRNSDFGYDPVVVASVRFANGAVGKLSVLLDGETPYVFNARLFGTNGTIQNNRVYSPKHYPGACDYWEFPTIRPDSGDVAHHPFASEISHFIACIDDDVESHASIHDSYRSMAVSFAIQESAHHGGRPIAVDLD